MNGSSRFACIDGFGEELDEILYEGISNWFISFRSLFTVYTAHFSYVVIFFSIISCGLLSYRHSTENGSKFTQFWWGALLHGVVSEQGLTARKHWHAQAPIMFLGKQLPLHIVLFYPSIIYLAMMGVQRLKLNACTEPAAVGLVAMLMEIPYRMISVKFLHITYHDTEPMFFHKLCGVPWVEIFSSMLLASSYVALYHGAHFYNSQDISSIWDSSSPDKKEKGITVLCGVLSPIAAFIQKIVLLHVLHDFFNVNPISCLLFATSVYISFVVCFEPKRVGKTVTEDTNSKTYLLYQVLIYMSCLLCLALLGKPQNEISIGTHEPTGDCTTLICSRTPLGKPVKRKKYLCADEIAARKNFAYNFDCLDEGPPCLNAIWYTICGSPIHNRAQFLLNLASLIILISTFFAKNLLVEMRNLDVAKRFIVRFRRETRLEESAASEGSREEVTVGFVLVENDVRFLPKDFQRFKKTLP